MKLNRYLPFAFIYFFFNSLALPFGLTYTAVLAPFFYAWLLYIRKRDVLLPFIILLIPFIIAHFLAGVETWSYAISLLNVLLIYIFCQAVYTFFKVCNDPEKIFRSILIFNFILCLIAIPFYFTSYYEWFWMEQNISAGITDIRRLKLFTYEPSYYATLFTPVFFYFLLQYFFGQNTIMAKWLLIMLFLPYVLSFSIGVIGAVLLAGFFTWLIWFRRLTRKRRVLNALISSGAFFISGMMILLLFFRNNPVFSRLGNVFAGEDTSGKGRTVDAFILANKILQTGNEYWGAGLGQIKIVGETIIGNYYLYYKDFVAAIPNAAAETLAIFGWVGFSVRLFIEIFLFFYTRVWINYYRLLLFFFMFIYQFTGSFITNVAEYVIWILAFTNVFRQFDVKPANKFNIIPPQQLPA
ncbi:MAG TPA: hypothetical protein VIZ28_08605 [Chitinophagaceae bacterium]